MKIGVLANLYGNIPFEEAMPKLKSMGAEAIEIGAGGYPGKAHCDPEILLKDDKKIEEFMDVFKKNDLELAALACHGNPINPDKEKAKVYDTQFREAVLLAEKIGVDTIVCFSGCPGGSPSDKMPNWITCPWPFEYSEARKYEWEQVLIPYWKEMSEFGEKHHVTRFAMEMHPGFCVYNPDTLMELRDAVGPTIGANYDPSHLVWQGCEPTEVIRYLGKAIYHVHAKDTYMAPTVCHRKGVLDTTMASKDNLTNRSWYFRSVGFGHDQQWWRTLISELVLAGYDRVLSIEHEDQLMSLDEGLQKSIDFLKECTIKDQ